jgi:hypothetical protein
MSALISAPDKLPSSLHSHGILGMTVGSPSVDVTFAEVKKFNEVNAQKTCLMLPVPIVVDKKLTHCLKHFVIVTKNEVL